jgi:Cdc6-like AAA superfamily ATPase
VYENTAKSAVLSVLEGYNATMLAYGQTGTGKTYTMEGFSSSLDDPQKGIIPRSMEEIFRYIENSSNKSKTFMVRASYLQIYNESITDLLKNNMTSLQIREDKNKGLFVEGLSEWVVRSPNDIYNLMKDGMRNRATAATKMNDISSRSHAVFIIIVEQMKSAKDGEDDGKANEEHKEIKIGKLNLVDLAGSERVRVTGATGKRLEESKSINKSLS